MQRKIIIGLVLTLVMVVFIPVYWATEPARQQSALERVTVEATERGIRIFAATCAACHGKTGDALPGKNLQQIQLDDEALFRIISRGNGGMPAFEQSEGGPLKPHEIDDVIVFLRNWDQPLVEGKDAPVDPQSEKPPVPPDAPSSPMPATPVVTPSPTTSIPDQTQPASPVPPPVLSPPPASPTPSIDPKALYTTNCAMCHGANREGGIGPALTTEALDDHGVAAVEDDILNGLPGTAMMSFKSILSGEEARVLAEFLKSIP